MKLFGFNVIGIVFSEYKVVIVCVYGCDYMIDYSCEDVVKCVCELMDGVGVDVVFDSVGKDIFEGLFDLLKWCGLMVCVGIVLGLILLFDL